MALIKVSFRRECYDLYIYRPLPRASPRPGLVGVLHMYQASPRAHSGNEMTSKLVHEQIRDR